MANVTLDIPDDLLERLRDGGQDVSQELRVAVAFSLCSRGELSTSQAARLAVDSTLRLRSAPWL